MAAFVSAGILAAGWQIGTAGGQAVPGATTATDAGTTASGTFTGTTETHRFGSVTVTVTLTDGKITALAEDVVSDGDHHSERINAQAVPMVRAEVLAADSADVSTISGATYTTEAYLTSLQSALDQAR